MKKRMILLCSCLLMAGCSASGSAVSAKNAAADREAGSFEEETKIALESRENQREVIEFLEQFEDELVFSDMDVEEAAFYGEPLKESYDFAGRVTEDGIGYVLAFKKTESSLLDGLSVYGKDDYIEAAVWSDQDEEYKPVYTFENIDGLFQGTGSDGALNEILYLQPIDMAAPEELQKAFFYRYCQGTWGAEYAEDVLKRGVRFTPPDSGAYLAVDRFENGVRKWEYVALTEEEEREILESDEAIMPVLYGEYGLEFYVSQETYEETDVEQGAVTLPALEIAEQRCGFKLREISDIHDIVSADMKLYMGRGEIEAEEEISDSGQLKELEEILASSEVAGEGKCPYSAVLTLTRRDGERIVVSLATDSCDGFVLESHGIYSPGKEKTKRIWELFPEIRSYTGWSEEQEAAATEIMNTDGPAGTEFSEEGK